MPRILDLYCGMGGLSLGFLAGLDGSEALGLDIDRYAVMTYNHNLERFNARAEVQDILEWEPRGEYDIVIGGVPCQPYSTANTRRRGKEHPLYPTLPRFFDIVLELKPKVFLMENVKGLVSRRHKPLLLEQLRRVEKDYRVAYRVLNAAYYGVPQRRERLFVLGVRRDLGVTPTFPEPTHAERETITLYGRLRRWITVREAIGDLLAVPPISYPKKLVQTNPRHGIPISLDEPSRTVKVDGRGGYFTFDTMIIPLTQEQVERILRERIDTSRHRARMEFPDSLDKPSRTISSHTIEGTKRETIIVPVSEHVMTVKGGWANPRSDWGSRAIPLDKPSYTITEKHRSGQLVEVSEHHVRLYRMGFSRESLEKHPPQELGKPSTTIRATFYKVPPDSTVRLGDGMYRRLTVRECLRLQSFPDWWGFPDGISISRKYRLVGEAVPPILAYRIAVKIGELLGWRTRAPSREVFMLPYYDRVFGGY